MKMPSCGRPILIPVQLSNTPPTKEVDIELMISLLYNCRRTQSINPKRELKSGFFFQRWRRKNQEILKVDSWFFHGRQKLHVLLSAVTDFSMRSNGVLNRRFLKFFEINAKLPSKPPRNLKITDVTVDASRNLWFRLFVPTQEEEEEQQSSLPLLPVLIFFHGGGFAYLSPDSLSYDVACRRFARESQIIVVSVNYRLSPEHRYPSQYDDGFDVLKFLEKRNCQDFPANADLKRCFLAGDSAGGNLAHHVACRFAAGTDTFRELNVVGLITIQPWFGGEERTEAEIRLANAPLVSLDRTDWLWKAFLPEGCNRDHEAINVFGPNSNVDIAGLKKFPVTLVVIGGYDPLQDWQRRYYEGLKRRGKEVYLVEYPNAIHAFYIFPELADTPALFAEVKNFIQKH